MKGIFSYEAAARVISARHSTGGVDGAAAALVLSSAMEGRAGERAAKGEGAAAAPDTNRNVDQQSQSAAAAADDYDDDASCVLSFAAPEYFYSENDGAAVLDVVRFGSLAHPLSVA
jgi:hypothetical protein